MSDTPKKRTYYRADYWQQHVNACHASGLSQTEYCREHGLAISTFHRWQKKLREADISDFSEPAPAAHFIEWPVESLQQSEPAPSTAWDIELSLGHGVVLRMRHC